MTNEQTKILLKKYETVMRVAYDSAEAMMPTDAERVRVHQGFCMHFPTPCDNESHWGEGGYAALEPLNILLGAIRSDIQDLEGK